MDMIRHDRPSMQVIVAPCAMQDGIPNDGGNLRHLQMPGPDAGSVEQPIHSHKRLS